MEYISHEDFKGMMNKLQASSPKGMLKEGIEEDEMEEGNAFTGQLHTHKPGEKFKVGGKEYKDTAKGTVPEGSESKEYDGSWGMREDEGHQAGAVLKDQRGCLLYTSPSPRD